MTLAFLCLIAVPVCLLAMLGLMLRQLAPKPRKKWRYEL